MTAKQAADTMTGDEDIRVIVDDGTNEARMARIAALLDTAENFSRQAEGADEANATAFRNEAAMMTSRAYELMDEHRITMAQLEARGKARGEKVERKEFLVGKPFTGKTQLLNALAQNLNCVLVRMGKVGATRERIYAYGFTSDLGALSMLWASVQIQGDRFCAADEKREGIGKVKARDGGVHPPTYRRAWWTAYAIGIYNRLSADRAQAERAADTSTPGTALVLSDKSAKVKKAIAEAHGQLRKGRRTTRRRYEGYAEGHEAAKKTDLSRNDKVTVTSDRKAIG